MSIDALKSVFTTYCAATGLAEATVSTRFLGRGGRFEQIKAGGDMGARTIDRIIADFAAHWPADAAWPDGVARPEPRPRGECGR